MAEGGYDPETTNPFDTHGGDDGDDDTTPLIPHRRTFKDVEMKHYYHKVPPLTSTSQKHETTFIEGTPSGKILFSEKEQEKAEILTRLKKIFVDPKLTSQ